MADLAANPRSGVGDAHVAAAQESTPPDRSRGQAVDDRSARVPADRAQREVGQWAAEVERDAHDCDDVPRLATSAVVVGATEAPSADSVAATARESEQDGS